LLDPIEATSWNLTALSVFLLLIVDGKGTLVFDVLLLTWSIILSFTIHDFGECPGESKQSC